MISVLRIVAALTLVSAGSAALPSAGHAATPHPGSAAPTATCDGFKATIIGTPANDDITGTSHRDVIVGAGGNDKIHGGGGDDVICGQNGADQLFGGAGDDRLLGGTDGAVSTPDGTHLQGDVLQGGAGDDLLDVGADARSAKGGRDLNVIDYGNSPYGVSIRLNTTVAGKGNGVATGRGRDVIVLRRFTAFNGSAHEDSFVGSALDDTFYGGAGNDTIAGGPGNDTLYADVVGNNHRPADNDIVDGGPGKDVIFSDAGRDTLRGGPGADVIGAGSLLATTVQGGAGPDTIATRITRESGFSLDGGDGRDTATVVEPNLIDGSPVALLAIDEFTTGVDAFYGKHAEGNMSSIENLTVTGPLDVDFYGTYADEILTGDGKHRIRAWMSGGNDVVHASTQNDYVNGGPGVDTAFAGGGADSCPAVERKHSC